MATYTDRGALRKPQRGSGINTDDKIDYVKDYNNNLEVLNDYIHCFPCTSVTKPETPFQGMLILESDTEQAKIWTGTAWLAVDDYANPRGWLGKSILTETSGWYGEASPGFPLYHQFTAQLNRRYAIASTFTPNSSSTAAPAVKVKACWAAGGPENLVANTNALQTQEWYTDGGRNSVTTGTTVQRVWIWENTTVDGAATVGVQISNFTAGNSARMLGGDTIYGYPRLTVRDVGATP